MSQEQVSRAPDSARKVGFEIEFAGIDAQGAARVLAGAVGGAVESASPHFARVAGSRLGDLVLELDTRYAKAAKDPGLIDRALEALGAREAAADMLAHVAPIELVTPPLAPDRFEALDQAVAALRAAGLQGTKGATLNAFGMHLNIQLVPPEPGCAIRVAGVYAFAEHWLRHVDPPDAARRATPFVDPYPGGYLRALAQALENGDVPRIESFVALYAHWNPNRNRGLDLWPLLGHLAPGVCARLRGRPVANARPAFHYRLPDSRLGQPGWSPRKALAQWDRLEAAADDPDAFEVLRRACLEHADWRIGRAEYLDAVAGVLG